MNQNGKPLVSIVTPSYNQAEFIEDTLKSVKNQDYSEIEHIVIDGESTDETLSILKEYEDRYNLRWISEPDDGQADALNKGLNMAKGTIIGWLNSDDAYLHINVIDGVVNEFEKSKADLIYGDAVVIGKDNLIKRVWCSIPWIDYGKLMRICIPTQPATFFIKKVIEKCRPNPNLEFVMDYDFWIQAMLKGFKFKHFDRLLACHRRYQEQKTLADPKKQTLESKRVKKGYNKALNSGFLTKLFDKLILALFRLKGLQKIHKIYQSHRKNAFGLLYDSKIKTILRQLFFPTIQF